MREHYGRPEGLPPVNGVQVSGLVHPAFRVEIEALAAI